MPLPYIDSVKGQITPKVMDMSHSMAVSCISHSSSNSQRKISNNSGSSGKSGYGSFKLFKLNSAEKQKEKYEPKVITSIR